MVNLFTIRPRPIPTLPAILLLAACAAPTADPLDPALRERVEHLKRQAALTPTSAQTVDERTAVLWAWANALALHGAMLPVNLPSRVNAVARARFDGTPPPEAILAELDDFIVELQLKDEQPHALGTLHFADTEPLVAGGWHTVQQVYTVGSQPLGPGSTLMLARQMMADQGAFQHEDPGGDNYVSVQASDPTARWERTRVPLAGMHGAFRGSPDPVAAFRLTDGSLAAGETVTVTYGDRRGGGRGWLVQTFAADELLLPVYVDLFGEGHFLSPRWPGLRVVGQTEVRSVRGFAPSVVAPGEPFDLVLRSEDPYENRPSGPIPAYQILLNGEPWGEIAASADAVSVVADVSIDDPGAYWFSIRSSDGRVTGASNPVWVREGAGRRLFWGETHGHTALAEGQGSPEGYFRFGRDDARLDFVTLSEHDALMDDWEWQRLQQLTREFHDEGRFITFLGYEWSAQRRQGGHHNVLFRTPERDRVPVQTANDLALLYEGLHAANDPEDVLVIPHAHNAGDWTRNDAAIEKLVEVASLHGTFEWFGNLYLKSGFEVGFIAATDDHRASPGYGTPLRLPFNTQRGGIAGVWAEEKSSDAIFDALRGLSAFASTGERILLFAELNGYRMGTRQPQTSERRLHCRVLGTSPIDRIDVVKNGVVVFSRSYLQAPLRSRSWLQIGFQSSSEVFFPPHRDNPRPYRIWDGTVDVTGASLLRVETPGFDNHYSERATIDPAQPNRLHFYTETRGRADTLLLELEGLTSSTILGFRLAAHTEAGTTTATVRPPADIPAADILLSLAELRDGRIERELQVDAHTDRLVLQLLQADGAAPSSPGPATMDRELQFDDLEPAGAGDYYYVRVTQLDGGQAFSSPFWVGDREAQ